MTTSIRLKRHCSAIKIPEGSFTRLTAGSSYQVRKKLNDTIILEDIIYKSLFQIDSNDIDAIDSCTFPLTPVAEHKACNTKEAILKKIKLCYDPEVPINVLDLGLIYEINLADDAVTIKMTLTSIACGMGDILRTEICSKLFRILELKTIKIQFIFEPVWSINMISEAGKLELGLL